MKERQNYTTYVLISTKKIKQFIINQCITYYVTLSDRLTDWTLNARY